MQHKIKNWHKKLLYFKFFALFIIVMTTFEVLSASADECSSSNLSACNNETTCEATGVNGYWCNESTSCVGNSSLCTSSSTELDVSCTPNSVVAGGSFTCNENSSPKIPVTWAFN